jgi:hypothetical protein
MFNTNKYLVTKNLEKVIVLDNKKKTESDSDGLKLTKLNKDYIKPIEGSVQDNMTTTEMINQVKGYRKLDTIEEKKVLQDLTLFKTRVKYYDTEKKKFRTGGVLLKVEYPKYIMLMNLVTKIGWSVQLDKNIIFVPEDKIDEGNKKQAAEKEKKIKDKLYKLYKNGEIIKK